MILGGRQLPEKEVFGETFQTFSVNRVVYVTVIAQSRPSIDLCSSSPLRYSFLSRPFEVWGL